VGDSSIIASHFAQPLDLLFIDGATPSTSRAPDFAAWAPKVVREGLLLIHDVFPDPRDGGSAPYEIYQAALDSRQFHDVASEGSLEYFAAGLSGGSGQPGSARSSGVANSSWRKSPAALDDELSASAANSTAAAVYDVVSRSGKVCASDRRCRSSTPRRHAGAGAYN